MVLRDFCQKIKTSRRRWPGYYGIAQNFKELFPENKNINMNVRHHEKYYVKKYKTERCKNTSVPYFQTLLNKNVKEQKVMFAKLVKSHSNVYVPSESYHVIDRCEFKIH